MILNWLIIIVFDMLNLIPRVIRILISGWVLMGIRIPFGFQSGASKEDSHRALKLTKPFKKKGLEGGVSIVKVARPGFEPGLFSSKGRRVASYTIGQSILPF